MTRGRRFELLLTLTLAGCSGPAFSTGTGDDTAGAGGAASAGAASGGSLAAGGSSANDPGVPYILPGAGSGGGGGVSGGVSPGGASSGGAPSAGSSSAGSSSAGGGSAPVAEPKEPVFEYLAVESTTQRGNTTTQTFLDDCPPGSLLVGVNAEVDQGIVASLQGVCGVPSIDAGEPSVVAIQPGETLEQRGCVPGATVTRACPASSAVVGFEGRSGLLLDQLSLRCAPLLLADGGLVLGKSQALEPIGDSGGTAFQRTECPEGALATGTNVGVSSFVSAFGLPCASVTLEWKAR